MNDEVNKPRSMNDGANKPGLMNDGSQQTQVKERRGLCARGYEQRGHRTQGQ